MDPIRQMKTSDNLRNKSMRLLTEKMIRQLLRDWPIPWLGRDLSENFLHPLTHTSPYHVFQHPHYPHVHSSNSYLVGAWPCPVNHLSVSTDGESWERPLLTTGSYRVDDHCLSYQTLEIVSQSSRCPTWEIFWLLHLPRDCFVTRNRVCGRTKFKPIISILSLSPANGGGWRKPTRCCLYIYCHTSSYILLLFPIT